MSRSTAHVATESASRYLQQLCKHWGHRFEVTFDPTQGTIAFDDTQSVMLAASDTGLAVDIESADGDKLPRLEQVVEDHLKRFAFREELAFEWKRAA